MKQQLKLINSAFDKLSWVFDACTTNYAERLLHQCVIEERSHRGFLGGDGSFASCHPGAASANQCAKQFAVLRVAEYLCGHKFPSGKDYLHTQTSCFIAAGIVDEFGKEIRIAWNDFDFQKLTDLDYLDLVQPDRKKEAV